MATIAQITANRSNASHSTGPRSPEGKAAVAFNHLGHGFSSAKVTVLPHEDPAAYAALLLALCDEHQPHTPTERFLVEEITRAQWKLRRAADMERELLSTPADPSEPVADGEISSAAPTPRAGLAAMVAWFRRDCSHEEALGKLTRYETTARRAFYRSLKELRAMRLDTLDATAKHKLQYNRSLEAALKDYLEAPPGPWDTWATRADPETRTSRNGSPAATAATPESVAAAAAPVHSTTAPSGATQNCSSKPMPAHLADELARHRRRDPDFHPVLDRSQTSSELRKWLDNHGSD